MSDPRYDSIERLREQVIDQLSNGYSNDFLSEHEFEDRVELATNAGTHQELRALILDLPVVSSPNPPVPVGQVGTAALLVDDSEVENESTVIAIFGGAERKGLWDPPKVLNTIAVFGGADIDLREARIPRSGMKINAVGLFGGVDVIVPPDVDVVVAGVGIFGGFGGKSRKAETGGDVPTVKVDGVAMFGGVDVKVKQRKGQK
jgi:hypothetical protein